MSVLRSSRSWRALFAGGAAVVAVAFGCAPEITFVPTKAGASHCNNQVTDPESGETDTDCGGECDGCALGLSCQLGTDCKEGDCLDGMCRKPGCTNGVRDSSETGIDCGGDCMPCTEGGPCGGPTDCSSKSCKDGHCAAPTCDDTVLNGDEASRDCGGATCDGCPIGMHCDVATDCISGACDETTQKCVLNCSSNTDDCDGDFEEECETNLLTSVRNCGSCGHRCELPHSSVSCVGGACQIDMCESPWERCDTDEANGCETNLSNDVKNCGACGMECTVVNGKASCVAGKCQVESCEDGYGDCDNDPVTGCEAGINDVENCLQCGKKCSAPDGAEPFCTDEDGCGYSDCEEGRGNCAGDPSGECANDLTNDADNCGRCGHVCTAAHGTARCENSLCVVDECEEGWANCNVDDGDGGVADGCEVNTQQSADNCGGCGRSCDVDNGDGTCQEGACGIVACETGYKNCDTTASDGGFGNGCETNTTSDVGNCGGCANVCMGAHAIMGCENSECVRTGCQDDYDDCTAADGCETDTGSSILHCGTCEGTCSKDGATTATCAGGSCAPPVCDPTHLNCDGDNANGCEATIGTPQACSACPAQGGACTTALPNCVLSGTAYHCQADIIVSNTAQGNVSSALLNNVSHTLATGSNRLVLVAVVGRSDNQASGVVQARPDTVTYGGVAMTKFDELGGPTNDAANLYYYYLTDTGSPKLPTGSGSQALVVDGTKHNPQPKAYIANVVQFNGVNQATPLVTGAKTTTGNTTTTISSTSTVAVSGSVLYSVVSAQYESGYKLPVDPDLASPLTMSQSISTTVVLAYAGVTPPRTAGAVTIAWNWNYAPQMSAQYSVIVQPATN